MKCKGCNELLSSVESVLKDYSGEYLDLCSDCYKAMYTTLVEDMTVETKAERKENDRKW